MEFGLLVGQLDLKKAGLSEKAGVFVFVELVYVVAQN